MTQMAKPSKATKTAKLTPGTKTAVEMRAVANTLTDEQRDASMSLAMQVIYGKGKKAVHAVRR
jgi:hypothetical protein